MMQISSRPVFSRFLLCLQMVISDTMWRAVDWMYAEEHRRCNFYRSV